MKIKSPLMARLKIKEALIAQCLSIYYLPKIIYSSTGKIDFFSSIT